MKRKMNRIVLITLVGVATLGGSAARAEEKEVDNTAVNARDRGGKTWTPQDQIKGSKADLTLAKNIRHELVRDDSLSLYAKNIKVVTTDGYVILRGPVRNQEEREKIVALAKRYAGEDRVEDALDVRGEQKNE